MNRVGLITWMISALALSACSANHHSIYRHKPLDNGARSITLVDAKQRAILTSAPLQSTSNRPASALSGTPEFRRFCAEPSPDVFAIIANSAAVGGAFGQTTQPGGIDVSANASGSSSEGASTIPRTQTNNLLRELMYRTCERYLSGGIDEMELSVQAIRDQRLIVSILAIEQLTGAVTPKPVTLTSNTNGAAGAGAESIPILHAAREEMLSARNAQAEAQTQYDNLNTSDGHCATALKAVAENKQDALEGEPKTKLEPCKAASGKLTAAKSRFGEANAHYLDVKQLAATTGVISNSGTDVSADGGLNQAEAIEDVAVTVAKIVSLNFNDTSETKLFCMRAIRMIAEGRYSQNEAVNDRLMSKCLAYLESSIAGATQYEELRAKEIEIELQKIRTEKVANFNQFIFKFGCRETQTPLCNGVDAAFGKAFPDGLTGRLQQILGSLNAAANRNELQAAFSKLAPNQQTNVITAQ